MCTWRRHNLRSRSWADSKRRRLLLRTCTCSPVQWTPVSHSDSALSCRGSTRPSCPCCPPRGSRRDSRTRAAARSRPDINSFVIHSRKPFVTLNMSLLRTYVQLRNVMWDHFLFLCYFVIVLVGTAFYRYLYFMYRPNLVIFGILCKHDCVFRSFLYLSFILSGCYSVF